MSTVLTPGRKKMGLVMKVILGAVFALGVLWLAGIWMLTIGLGLVLSWLF